MYVFSDLGFIAESHRGDKESVLEQGGALAVREQLYNRLINRQRGGREEKGCTQKGDKEIETEKEEMTG